MGSTYTVAGDTAETVVSLGDGLEIDTVIDAAGFSVTWRRR